MPVATLETPRLLLRDWRDGDLAPFAALNADPGVRRYFPGTLSREESDAQAANIRANLAAEGWGLWAVEVKGVCDFAGFIGLARPGFEARFTPCVEVGWRLASAFHGRGYATEGARAVVAYAFQTLQLPELVSMTVVANAASRRVMEKLGFTRDPAEDFDHPKLAEGDPLRRHVLYRLKRGDFRG